jgi:hypothetical protein
MTDVVQEQENTLQIEPVWMYSPFPANCDPYTAETTHETRDISKFRVLPWKFAEMVGTIWCNVYTGKFEKVAAVGIDKWRNPALLVEQEAWGGIETIGQLREGHKYCIDNYCRIDHLSREQQWAWHNVRVAFCLRQIQQADRDYASAKKRGVGRTELKDRKKEVERWNNELRAAEMRVRVIGNTIQFENSEQIIVNRFGIQKPQELIISSLVLSTDTQSRIAMNEEQIERYVEDLKRGDVFPPIQVFTDGSKNYVTDGFHRTEAHRRAGRETIMAMVQAGGFDEATWDSYGANRTNGLQRTRSDIARATQNALKHKNAAKLSDQQIAKHIGVDPKTVAKYRAQLVAAQEIPEVTERVGADGKTYNTNKIGARAAEKASTSIRATLDNFKFSTQHFYAIDHEEKIVYSAPFIKLESVREWNYLLRGYSGADVLAMREGDKLEGYTFETDEPPVLKLPTPKPAVPVSQPEPETQPEPAATETELVTAWWEQDGLRYSPLMAATCKACKQFNWTQMPIVGWKPSETPRLWVCPKCGKRRADHLMQIAVQETLFRDEPPAPQPDPDPDPQPEMSEWLIGGKPVTLQEWQDYVEANEVHPPLVEPDTNIVLAHFASFFTALKFFDEHPVLTKEYLDKVRGKYDDEAIDLLDSIVALQVYDIEQSKGGDGNKRK